MRSTVADHEYRALREAIAARGQLRASLTLAGLVAWAAVLTTVLIALPYPVAAVLPLTVILATFEVIRPLHFGAERIGRYLQVFHEEPAPGAVPKNGEAPHLPAWERTAMAFGPAVPGAAGHPLAIPTFAIAVAVNFLAVVLPGPIPVELGLLSVPHAALAIWLARADRAMRRQRTTELARFRELRDRPS